MLRPWCPLATATLAALIPAVRCAPAQAATDVFVAERKTEAGLRIWDFPDDDADRFCIAAIVGVGGRDEPSEQAGIAHFLEHALFLQAREHPNVTRDRDIMARGLTYNGYTTSEVTVYYITGRAEHWQFMVGWLADHVLQPSLLDDEVTAERRIVLEEIATNGPDFDAITTEHLLYGDHALARSVGGSAETVASIDAEDLRAFHDRYYRAENMAIGFSGRVASEECMERIDSAFAAAPAGAVAAVNTLPKLRTGDLWTDPDLQPRSARFELGYHVRCRDPKELATLLVTEAHLRRRFFEVAREQRHLCYAPRVALDVHRDVHQLTFSCDTSERGNVAKLAEVAQELVAELGSLEGRAVEPAATMAMGRLQCESARDLTQALELAAWVTWHGGELNDFMLSVIQTEPATIAATSARLLAEDQRYSLSSTTLLESGRGSKALLFLLVIAVLGLVYFGRDYTQSVRGWFGSRLKPKGKLVAMPKRASPEEPLPTEADGDEIERSIQRYFDEEDGTKDGR